MWEFDREPLQTIVVKVTGETADIRYDQSNDMLIVSTPTWRLHIDGEALTYARGTTALADLLTREVRKAWEARAK